MNPKVIQVIISYTTLGAGVEGDPVRTVTQVFTLEGELIAENDPYKGEPP